MADKPIAEPPPSGYKALYFSSAMLTGSGILLLVLALLYECLQAWHITLGALLILAGVLTFTQARQHSQTIRAWMAAYKAVDREKSTDAADKS